jgi:hypothetical protein
MTTKNNILIYIIIFIIIILIIFSTYYFYYNKKIKSSTPSTLTNNDKLKLANYKKKIIEEINRTSRVNEPFIDFNNKSVDTRITDYVPTKCESLHVGLENGAVNEEKIVKCSNIFPLTDKYMDGNFKVKCHDNFKWNMYEFNCNVKGIDEKIDITGNWHGFRFTDDEKNGTVPIDFNRELTEEEKNNPRNTIIIKNFNLETEKGIVYIDGRDSEIQYIKTVGYVIGTFPIGFKFIDNGKFNILLCPGFFLKKAE